MLIYDFRLFNRYGLNEKKISKNIVYTLVFYYKKEIMAVKENIIEFLNILKEDSVDEVWRMCAFNFERENPKPKICLIF